MGRAIFYGPDVVDVIGHVPHTGFIRICTQRTCQATRSPSLVLQRSRATGRIAGRARGHFSAKGEVPVPIRSALVTVSGSSKKNWRR